MRRHLPIAPPLPKPMFIVYGHRDNNSLAFTDDPIQADGIAEGWALKNPGKTVWVAEVRRSFRHTVTNYLPPNGEADDT